MSAKSSQEPWDSGTHQLIFLADGQVPLFSEGRTGHYLQIGLAVPAVPRARHSRAQFWGPNRNSSTNPAGQDPLDPGTLLAINHTGLYPLHFTVQGQSRPSHHWHTAARSSSSTTPGHHRPSIPTHFFPSCTTNCCCYCYHHHYQHHHQPMLTRLTPLPFN